MKQQAASTTKESPPPYSGFAGQYIDGAWRPGRHAGILKDTDPYSGETLAEIALADGNTLARTSTPGEYTDFLENPPVVIV